MAIPFFEQCFQVKITIFVNSNQVSASSGFDVSEMQISQIYDTLILY